MILVTGASGFIGSAIADSFRESEVLAISRSRLDVPGVAWIGADLTSERAVRQISRVVGGRQVTHVFHAAAVTPWSGKTDYSDDLLMAQRVAELCKILNVGSVCNLSGWTVYSDLVAVPIEESAPLLPSTDYGKSKLVVEKYLKSHCGQTPVINLRLASIYGPGQTSPGLITNMVATVLGHKELQLSALETKRDYLLVDDLLVALKKLVQSNLDGNDDINLGSGRSIAVREVAEMVKVVCREVTGYDAKINVRSDINESPIRDNQLSIAKARSLGLLDVTTPFQDGLRRYVEWAKI